MAIFGVKLEEDNKAKLFMQESNDRLQDNSIVKNPFYGRIALVPNSEDYYIVDMEPVYLKAYWGGAFILMATLVFTGFKLTLWLLPGIALLCCSIFWSKYFLYIMMRIGLRKAGYMGKIRLVNNKIMMKALIENVL